METQLAQGVTEMSKALETMLADYKALEKYVADHTIKDDGAQGKKLVQSLRSAHTTFMAARKSFLETVEARAAQAEDLLLWEHPLKRQIVEARKIFSLFRQAGDLLAPEEPDNAALEQLRGQLEASLHVAGQPPFPAAPAGGAGLSCFSQRSGALFPKACAGGARRLSQPYTARIERKRNAQQGSLQCLCACR